MSYRRIEIDCDNGALDALDDLEGADAILHTRRSTLDGGRERIDLIVGPAKRQVLLDALQERLGEGESSPSRSKAASEHWRMVVLPVDAILPMPERDEDATGEDAVAAREEIFNAVTEGASLTRDFAVLCVAAAIVASLGMVNDSTAVVIGAMVIAPLLGPILALVLATALGERRLILRSLIAGAAGIALVVGVGLLAGLIVDIDLESRELMLRTELGIDVLVLALASGVAAALSATSGKHAPLVGVMVAAALLPPFAAAGLFIGAGHMALAGSAALAGICNVVSINLAGQLVFLWKGVRPQSWYKRGKAHQSVRISLLALGGSVIALSALLIWLQG
jgi:uncharacterized hydrophobic protein (TIGR00341 family)